jgi:branched-chain amino acid transport system substrate-binding protein
MHRRTLLKGAAATATTGLFARRAAADTPLKMGISIPLTGAGFAAVGRQATTAIKLYMEQHGDTVAGRKIQLTIRDDGGVADVAHRIVQDMIVNDRVDIVGIGITPTSLAVAPLITQSKKATLVISSGASITTTKSPYFVRAGFILSPQSWILAEWAAKNGSKRVVTLVNEWAPGIEAETAFTTRFKQVGGEIMQSIRIPLANPDFAPFLQRVGDLKPDTAFIYFPGTQAPIFAKQFAERGLGKSGPDFVSLGGYDGMHLIYEALKKTNGNSDGDALIAAMEGMAWESPRGPVSIDPATRDIVSNIYIRKVEKLNGQLWSTEFQTFPNVKDPMKAAGK